MKKGIALLLFSVFLYKGLIAQYSYLEIGTMRMNYKNKGVFKDAFWPGFTINVGGIHFTRFAGEVPLRDTGLGTPAYWKPHGSYWNIGYTKTFHREDETKREFFAPYAGVGMGGWFTHGGGAWCNLMLNGGAGFSPLKNISFNVGIETGMNFKGVLGMPVYALFDGVQASFPRFYLNPRAGVRIAYDLSGSIGDYKSSKEYYHSPGWKQSEYRSGDYIYRSRSYSSGGSWSDHGIVTSNELLTIAPLIYFPRSFDGVAVTRAFGGRLALRAGLLAADIQYVQGKIGFEIASGSFAGSQTNASYWDYSGRSFSLGINAFNLFMPFRRATLYRFIIGQRFNFANMRAHYVCESSHILPPEYSDKNVKNRSFFMAAEFGRMGVSWDYFKSPMHTDHKSGGLIAAYYMIPLVR